MRQVFVAMAITHRARVNILNRISFADVYIKCQMRVSISLVLHSPMANKYFTSHQPQRPIQITKSKKKLNEKKKNIME